MTRLLSYSELKTAMDCLARWDFAYGGRLAGSALRSRRIAPRLSEGRAFGAAAAEWHAQSSSLLANWLAHQAAAESLEADFDEMRAAGVPVTAGELSEAHSRISAVLDHYMATAEPMPLTRLEDELDVPLPSRGGVRGSNRYRFTGRIDGFAPDELGHQWIVEFKLRGQLMPAWLIQLSAQLRWYSWALGRQQGDQFPVGVLVEERLNGFPLPARILKSGQPSKDQAQHTTGELYRQACAETGAEVDELVAEMFDRRQWQQRTPIVFRPGELEDAAAELVGAARLIAALDAGEIVPIRNASRAHCSGCQFREICPAPSDRLFVESLFERIPAKRDRVNQQREAASVNTT